MAHKNLNAIPLLLIATLISTLALACSRSNVPLRAEGQKANSSEKYTASLSTFQELKGTPFLMATLNSGSWTRSDKSSSSGAYGTDGQTHNLVFLEVDSLKSRRLFDSNAYVISQTDQYTQRVDGKTVTRWLVHQVLKADTDGNHQLDRNDLLTLGISSPNGKNYVEVLMGISEVFGLTMNTPGKLVVVYGKSGMKSASIIDLDKGSVIATQSIVELGTEVK
jgi:hypothetical protein